MDREGVPIPFTVQPILLEVCLAAAVTTKSNSKAVRCSRDIAAFPLEAFRLPTPHVDRKWKYAAIQRSLLARALADAANPNGSGIELSIATMGYAVGVKAPSRIAELIADLTALALLTMDGRFGRRGTACRTLHIREFLALTRARGIESPALLRLEKRLDQPQTPGLGSTDSGIESKDSAIGSTDSGIHPQTPPVREATTVTRTGVRPLTTGHHAETDIEACVSCLLMNFQEQTQYSPNATARQRTEMMTLARKHGAAAFNKAKTNWLKKKPWDNGTTYPCAHFIANFETYAFQKERESSTVATPEIIKASTEAFVKAHNEIWKDPVPQTPEEAEFLDEMFNPDDGNL